MSDEMSARKRSAVAMALVGVAFAGIGVWTWPDRPVLAVGYLVVALLAGVGVLRDWRRSRAERPAARTSTDDRLSR